MLKLVSIALNRVEQRSVTEHCGGESEGADCPVHVVPKVLAVVLLMGCPKHPRYMEPRWTATVHVHDLRRGAVNEPRVCLPQGPRDRHACARIDVGTLNP